MLDQLFSAESFKRGGRSAHGGRTRRTLRATYSRSGSTPPLGSTLGANQLPAGDAANLKRLLGLDADAFVTVERIEDELGSVVHSLQHRSPLEVAARAFEEAESLDDVARDAVVTALRSVPPIHTVKALANRLGVRRKRIWDGFRPIQVRTGWSCLDLLHAVALWRTIEVVRNGWNIRKAVQDLGLSPRTTRRMCRSLLGCTPSDLLAYADKLEAAVLEFLERALAWDGGGTD